MMQIKSPRFDLDEELILSDDDNFMYKNASSFVNTNLKISNETSVPTVSQRLKL